MAAEAVLEAEAPSKEDALKETVGGRDATPQEKADEDARRAVDEAKPKPPRIPSIEELWAILKNKSVVSQDDVK